MILFDFDFQIQDFKERQLLQTAQLKELNRLRMLELQEKRAMQRALDMERFFVYFSFILILQGYLTTKMNFYPTNVFYETFIQMTKNYKGVFFLFTFLHLHN